MAFVEDIISHTNVCVNRLHTGVLIRP